MSDPEMRLLRYFVVVAEERHFGHAAERLHMAQPPLSQQIRKLEHQLGVELIDRSRRPIELTDAGNAVFEEAQLSLVHAQRAFAAAVICDDHPLVEHHRIAPALLADEPIILWARSAAPTTYGDVVELFRQHKIQPQVLDEITRIQTILALVASGAGIALLPTSFINLHRQGVQFRPLHEPLPYRPLALAWRSGNQSPSLMRFIDVARRTSTYYLHDLTQRYPQLRPAPTP
jgi:DNA-binding transcriptional LysR family regulator